MPNLRSLETTLRAEISDAPSADASARQAVQARVDDILRPTGAFSVLDAVAVHLAGWQRTATPDVTHPIALIFAADHGVAQEGVSAYPAEVTAEMLRAFERNRATVSALAEVAGVAVTAIDVGVGRPTANLRAEPALTEDRFLSTFERGRNAVRAVHSDLLILGEMGIGNTTAAAAVTAATLGGPVAAVVGRGTGVDGAAFENKVAVVEEAVARIDGVTGPLEILREVGGAELVAIAGAITEARLRSIPVVLDGYIASTPALVMHAFDRRFGEHLLAGHGSPEPGHGVILEQLSLEPLITLDLRLGEASGAVAAVPLLKMACRAVTNVATFSEWFGDSKGLAT